MGNSSYLGFLIILFQIFFILSSFYISCGPLGPNLLLILFILFCSLGLVRTCNHKTLGIYYLGSSLLFGISGTLCSLQPKLGSKGWGPGPVVYNSLNNNIIILINYGPSFLCYFISVILSGLTYLFILTLLLFSFIFYGWSRDLIREIIIIAFLLVIFETLYF